MGFGFRVWGLGFRPISLGSTIGKVFGQMLLARTPVVLHPSGPEQCAHAGRQTADYIHSAIRTFQLETEWRWGLHWMKLDIRKASDSLSRSRALQHLRRVFLPGARHWDLEVVAAISEARRRLLLLSSCSTLHPKLQILNAKS